MNLNEIIDRINAVERLDGRRSDFVSVAYEGKTIELERAADVDMPAGRDPAGSLRPARRVRQFRQRRRGLDDNAVRRTERPLGNIDSVPFGPLPRMRPSG